MAGYPEDFVEGDECAFGGYLDYAEGVFEVGGGGHLGVWISTGLLDRGSVNNIWKRMGLEGMVRLLVKLFGVVSAS